VPTGRRGGGGRGAGSAAQGGVQRGRKGGGAAGGGRRRGQYVVCGGATRSGMRQREPGWVDSIRQGRRVRTAKLESSGFTMAATKL
jgi:hypothetical protein